MTKKNQAKAMSLVNDLSVEINKAYIVLVGQKYATAEGCEDSYTGEYDSDEDFAQDMAEQIEAVNHDAKWPYNCIDWEMAARDLMYDYMEQDGYYFRNI